MLCIMYFIIYVDCVDIGTAAGEIQKELRLSNTELGLVFSAFAYRPLQSRLSIRNLSHIDDATVPASRSKSSRDFSPGSISPS